MISKKAVIGNSRLVNFHGTKELVLRNSVPKENISFGRSQDSSMQSSLFMF